MPKTKKMPKLIGLRSEPQGLTYSDLDPKIEQPVVRALWLASDAQPIATLAEACFLGNSRLGKRARNRRQAMSWARNALRRPHREGLVERVERGVWRLTRKGKREVAS